MVAAFSVGPLGAMTDLVVAPAVAVETSRASSEFVSSGGVRTVLAGRAAPRAWSVSRPWQEPGFVRVLEAAARGLIGPVYLYDRATAMQNLLPDRLACGAGAPVLVDGLPIGAVSWTSVRVWVLAGRTYTLSCWGQSALAQMRFTPPGGTPTDLLPAAGGYAYRTFTPTQDGVVTLTRLNNQVISGVRVHEGDPDRRFHASSGTPCQVAVTDPSTTYQLVMGGQVLSDYQVELREVGQASF